MKKANRTVNNFRILAALLISTLMCFCMCACGGSGNTEETIEITTPSQEATTMADNQIKTATTAKDEDDGDKDGSEDQDSSAEKTNKGSNSQYAKIYKDYNAKMKEATEKYIDELEDKSSSVSKSKLYDETQDRIEALKEIYDEGKDMMVEAMLASTEDDDEIYEKYFKKMTEAYTEFSRSITSVYTDAF